MVENDWDVVEFRHEDNWGFVSDWYKWPHDDLMHVATTHAVDTNFPFYSVVKLRNGQTIRVKKKEGK